MCDNTINKDEKLKFNDKAFDRELEINKVIYVPGMLPASANHQSSNIDIETKLMKAESTYKQKNIMKLDTDQDNKNKDYRNFSMVSEKSRESINHGDYIRNGFKGNGRGFGDVNIDAELRYGANSREDQKNC